MKSTYISSLMAVFLAVLSCACTDEIELPDGIGGTFDGSIRPLSVELAFEPSAENELESRADNGDVMQDINSLRLFVYGDDGILLGDYLVMNGGTGVDVPGVISNVVYSRADNRLPHESELQDDSSGRVTFSFNIRTGRYYIYAVANADDLQPEQYSTRDKLKSVSRPWIVGDISANSEMFGTFSNAPDRGAAAADVPVAVTTEVVKMHCWLRRLASKVTVAFDGTQLYDNVQVFIDSVSLYDIPRNCTFGLPNTPGRDLSSSSPDAMLPPAQRYSAANGLIYRGDVEVIQNLESNGMLTPGNYLHVCNTAHPYLGKGEEGSDITGIDKRHAHAAKSLFFYENMQGKGRSGCKLQDSDGNNKIDNPEPIVGDPASGWKDGKAYGTYVEVHGWYRCSTSDGHVGQGPILYRFMLGKDTDSDFDAERNTHYQLTLRFKGYGNDADWHIVYSHERGIQVASPQYVSYLFNKKMMTTVKVSGDIPVGCYLKAEIKENNCRPWGDGSNDFPSVGNDFFSPVPLKYDKNYLGFLSLRQTNVVKIEAPGYEGIPSSEYDESLAYTTLAEHYESGEKGVRYYTTEPGAYDSNDVGENGRYFVEATLLGSKDQVLERVFNIPLYTRAKELVTWTGFTGNNPYTEYPRHAVVTFTVVDGIGESARPVSGFKPVMLDVVQVRRVENPKGVWRSMKNNDPFHVTLTRRPSEHATVFEAFNSIGKWSAEVLTATGSPQVVTLSTTEAGSGSGNRPQNMVSRIEGETEHPVDFMINFTGAKGCAVVRVRYHDFSCEHDIFCRKGFEDEIDLVGDGKLLWSTFNVHHFEGNVPVMTVNPAQEGSLFRHCSKDAILAQNNTDPSKGLGKNPGALKMLMSDGTTKWKVWGEMPHDNGMIVTDNTLNRSYYKWEIDGGDKSWRIPTGEDFYTFISDDAKKMDFVVSKAYGVLYGDGATEVQTATSDAYGYADENGAPSKKGMRGVFVYNNRNWAQIFFPIGMTGYGRRKGGALNGETEGVMRYANRATKMDVNTYRDFLSTRPMFYRLYEYPGAIYWHQHFYEGTLPKKEINGKEFEIYTYSSAFDINYYTMGFEGFGNNAMSGNTDACFIRLVRPVK